MDGLTVTSIICLPSSPMFSSSASYIPRSFSVLHKGTFVLLAYT